ncbi:hypothetical protein ACNOYE_36940 [Nannocystaceae bacterium ST9]
MARSKEEQARRARKYGRRMRLLKAQANAKEFDKLARALLAELRTAGVTRERIAALERGLEYTDVTRHRAAVWAIVQALEDVEG